MATVDVDIDFGSMENEHGGLSPSVSATCSECGHVTHSFGQGGASVRRCLVLLREECPLEENNFYKAAPGDEDDY